MTFGGRARGEGGLAWVGGVVHFFDGGREGEGIFCFGNPNSDTVSYAYSHQTFMVVKCGNSTSRCGGMKVIPEGHDMS